jgi:hypothetical protein
VSIDVEENIARVRSGDLQSFMTLAFIFPLRPRKSLSLHCRAACRNNPSIFCFSPRTPPASCR